MYGCVSAKKMLSNDFMKKSMSPRFTLSCYSPTLHSTLDFIEKWDGGGGGGRLLAHRGRMPLYLMAEMGHCIDGGNKTAR